MSTILVVDDQATNREMLATLLAYDGHRILQAGDGAEALGVVRREHPSLVVADIVMPTMDGYEFVKQLRRDWHIATTPVMFYTANYFEQEARGLATACGVHHVLTKPAEPEQILRMVNRALAAGEQPAVTARGAQVDHDFDREHIRLVTDKLSAKVAELEATQQRLRMLVAIGQRLNRRHDVDALLREFIAAAREVMSTRFSAVALLDRDGRRFDRIDVAGLSDANRPVELRAPVAVHRTPLGLSLDSDGVVRTDLPIAADETHDCSGSSAALVVRLTSAGQVAGAICFAAKRGEAFTDEDEQMAASLAAKFSLAYENAMRLSTVEEQNAELERRVATRTAELQRSNEELRQFAYVASHDLQEPLRMVASYVKLLADRYQGKLDSDADEFIGYAVDGATRMHQLILALLEYSRVGSLGQHVASCDAETILRDVLANLRDRITTTGAVVTHDPLPTVSADSVQVTQLLQNLIANAIKFHGDRPSRIHIDAARHGNGWQFAVRDNGIGIDPQHFERIFVIFQRLHTRDAYGGTGIGLAICKKIVDCHRGRIWVESDHGKGSTFFFTIPDAD